MFSPHVQNAAIAPGANAVESANITQGAKVVDEPNPITSFAGIKSFKRQRKIQSTDLDNVLVFDAVGLIVNLYKVPYGSSIPGSFKEGESLNDTDRYWAKKVGDYTHRKAA